MYLAIVLSRVTQTDHLAAKHLVFQVRTSLAFSVGATDSFHVQLGVNVRRSINFAAAEKGYKHMADLVQECRGSGEQEFSELLLLLGIRIFDSLCTFASPTKFVNYLEYGQLIGP